MSSFKIVVIRVTALLTRILTRNNLFNMESKEVVTNVV